MSQQIAVRLPDALIVGLDALVERGAAPNRAAAIWERSLRSSTESGGMQRGRRSSTGTVACRRRTTRSGSPSGGFAVDRRRALVSEPARGEVWWGRVARREGPALSGAHPSRAPCWADLMILDEPTDGLDPAGIHEMRRLLAGMAHEGAAAASTRVWVAAAASTRCGSPPRPPPGRWRRRSRGITSTGAGVEQRPGCRVS